MKRLNTSNERGAFLAGLSIGDKLKVALTPGGLGISAADDAPVDTYDAQVVEKYVGSNRDADTTDVQVAIPGVVGGHIATIWHMDGESTKSPDPREDGFAHGCYFAVAEEQPDADDDEPIEVQGVEEPAASVALARTDLPRGAAWLLEQASILEREAAKYKQYSAPQQSLQIAANQLRSAVGHVLAGGCEVGPTTAAASPF